MNKDSILISLPAKVTAIVLLVITTFISVAGSISFAYMVGAGYFTESFDVAAGNRYNNLMTEYPDLISNYKMGYKLENFMYLNKTAIIIWTSVCILAAVVLFVYLMYAAGRRCGADGITHNFIDRIPLDLYAGLTFFVLHLSIVITADIFNMITDVVQVIITIPFLIAMFLLLLSFIMSLATRLKTGGIFRNTLTFFVLKFVFKCFAFFGRSIIWLFQRLPLLWKGVLSFLTYMIFNTVLTIALLSGGGLIFLFWFFLNTVLLFIICTVGLQLGDLKMGGEKLASGELTYKIPTNHLLWDFRRHAENLNGVGEGMQLAVNERMKSEHFKTELITNVSHDIKTPLTSIINYVDLLKKEDLRNETVSGYIEVLERQSARLKKLTEDLVEASKASTGNITVTRERTDIAEFLSQCIAEYSERFTASALTAVAVLPGYPMFIEADGRLLWRIFDNLLSNVTKYTLAGTRVYFSAYVSEKAVHITLRNISREPLNLTPDELMERFVRGDASRNTEGSGLGLSIARSLTELQGGKLSLDIDGDLFKVLIEFPCAE